MENKNPINKIIRRGLRILAYVALLTELIFSIMIPKIKGCPVYLDTNDGYIIGGAIALLLSIEGIKSAVDAYVAKKTRNLNNK